MKLIKWMTVTALATATVFGSFVESAEAQLTPVGNQISGRRSNDIAVDYEFSIFSRDEDGNLFQDQDENNEKNMGSFLNAIVDFKASFLNLGSEISFKDFCIDDFCTEEFLELAVSDVPTFNTPFTLNLDTKLVSSNNASTMKSMKTIEYILSGSKLEENTGITEIAFILEELDGDGDAFDFFFSEIESLNTPEKQIEAVNSLEYIIDNEILNNANFIRVSGPDLTGQIVSSKASSGDFDILVDPLSVPEPVSTSSLLSLGLLGVGLGFKRKLK
jgi:hypothetical protein